MCLPTLLSFWSCFVLPRSFAFPYKSVSTKICCDFDWDCVKSIGHFGGLSNAETILRLSICERDVLHLFRLLFLLALLSSVHHRAFPHLFLKLILSSFHAVADFSFLKKFLFFSLFVALIAPSYYFFLAHIYTSLWEDLLNVCLLFIHNVREYIVLSPLYPLVPGIEHGTY